MYDPTSCKASTIQLWYKRYWNRENLTIGEREKGIGKSGVGKGRIFRIREESMYQFAGVEIYACY